MSSEEKTHELYQTLIELGKAESITWWSRGKILSDFKKKSLWKGYADSWTAFLADPELGRSVDSQLRDLRLFDFYGNKMKCSQNDIKGIDVKKLDKIKKIVNEKTLESWLDKCKVNSYSDIINMVEFKDKDIMKCPHKNTREYTAKYKCLDCGCVQFSPFEMRI